MESEKNFRTLMDEIVKNGKREQMEELGNVFDDLMGHLRDHHPEMYEQFYQRVSDIMKDDHLTQEEAEKYVSNLHHKDGEKGEYFSCKQVEEIIRKNPELEEYNKHDVYYVMNMVRSDFYKPNWGVDTYVMFTIMFFEDPDGKTNKAKLHAETFHRD